MTSGAGTGKTTRLVQEVVWLLRSGRASPAEICVVTGGPTAVALRRRITEAVDEEARSHPDDRRLVEAHRHLDDMVVDTVEGVARRLLSEHAVAAGVPPGFTVLDDGAERADFEDRFDRFADLLLSEGASTPGDDTLGGAGPGEAVVRALALGVGRDELADVAREMHDHRDRLAGGALDALRRGRPRSGTWPPATADPVVEAVDRALALRRWCSDPDDKLHDHLVTVLAATRARLVRCRDEAGTLRLVDGLRGLAPNLGQQANWSGRVEEVRAACDAVEAARVAVLTATRHAVAAELGYRLGRFVATVANERRAEGRLGPLDVLVQLRLLLRHEGEVTASLARRYRYVLGDDLDGADALRLDVVAGLAAVVGGGADHPVAHPRARGVQSVGVGGDGGAGDGEPEADRPRSGGPTEDNVRSVPGIVAFVNAVTADRADVPSEPRRAPQRARRRALPLRSPGTGGGAPGGRGLGTRSFAWGTPLDHTPLQLDLDGMGPPTAAPFPGADRAPVPSGPAVPPVVVLGGPGRAPRADLRRLAAAEVAGAVRRVVDEGWAVHDPATGTVRPARWRDVAVLFPSPEGWAVMEHAFDAAGIPAHLQDAAMAWHSPEVQDVLATLRAVDDPVDPLAVVRALRTPALACGDDDLVTWRRAGGGWDPCAPPPVGLGRHPVAEAMAVIAGLHHRRPWCRPGVLVGVAMEELRSLELCLVHGEAGTRWRRLHWLAGQARRFDEGGRGTLRQFLRWADHQAEADRRRHRPVDAAAGADAVRVTTVPATRGLEFPVVVLAGCEDEDRSATLPPAVLWDGGRPPELRLGRTLTSAGYGPAAERHRLVDARERAELLDLGLTRARDHLVVAVHHREPGDAGDPSPAARLWRLCLGRGDLWRRLPVTGPESAAGPVTVPVAGTVAGTVAATGTDRTGGGAGPVSDGDEQDRVAAIREAFSLERPSSPPA